MDSPGRPAWDRDAKDWPNRAASRFVSADGLRWHVQIMGQGPYALLLHGTGSATHSWRGLAPALVRDFTIVAPDMPGHGFTASPPAFKLSLPGMARAIAALLAALDVRPEVTIGHSAGAAILARMALDGAIAPRGIVSLNGALLPMRGPASGFFAPAAKLLASLPLVPSLLAWRARDRHAIERLLEQTGSRIEPAGIEFYRRLIANPEHVAATLAMMAHWDLPGLARDLPKLATPLALVVGGNDRTVPPGDAERVRALVAHATIDTQDGLGHLAHEEDPEGTAEIVRRRAATWPSG